MAFAVPGRLRRDPRLLWASVLTAALLTACGGGGDSTTPAAPTADEGSGRERAMALPANTTIAPDAATKGYFGPVTPWPIIAIHMVLTSDGRVLSYGTRTDGGPGGYFNYDVYDPTDGSHLALPNQTAQDIFCSSQVQSADGASVFISGGDVWNGKSITLTGNNQSSVYSVGDRTLAKGSNMSKVRWYSSSTLLLNGEVYVQGGFGGAYWPEVRQADGTYRVLTGAVTNHLDASYPRNYVAPDGRIFGYDSLGKMYFIDTAGKGALENVGQFPAATSGSSASAAMFAPGQILQYGGSSNQAIVIDINSATPKVASTGNMLRQRKLSNATLMPDGQVVAIGGSKAWNEMVDVSYEAEIWNPRTGEWTVGAKQVRHRLYHSTALLMPDGTIMSNGGGGPAPAGATPNQNYETYYPPYLFTADGKLAPRPVIDSAPTVVNVGGVATVQASGSRPIKRITFVKTGSVTHAWNMDQRFLDLPFTASGNTFTVQFPSRAGNLPPGMWMMFALDDAGVPSVAKMVRVNIAGPAQADQRPTLAAIADQETPALANVDLRPVANDPNGNALTFSASGLPMGLSINPATGAITGRPTTPGAYYVIVAASDGTLVATRTLKWTVTASGVAMEIAPAGTSIPAQVGTETTFSASATGTDVKFRWDFGDGSPLTEWSTSGTARHTYTKAGVFYVTVMVTDPSGAIVRRTQIQNAYYPTSAAMPVNSSDIALERRASGPPRLWVVNPDNDTVSVFDTSTRSKVAEIGVEFQPVALAFAPDGTAWVTNKKTGSISVINPSTLTVARTIRLPRGARPHGIVMASKSSTALVVNEGLGTVQKIFTATGSFGPVANVGTNPRHIAVAADGTTAYVSRHITRPLPGESTTVVQTTVGGQPVGGEVLVVASSTMTVTKTIVLAHSDLQDFESQGRGVPNYLGAAAISPDGTQAYVPSKQDNVKRGMQRDNLPLNFQNTVRAISSRIDMTTLLEDLPSRVDHDNASVASAATYDPLGVYLFVSLETSREVSILDAHSRTELLRLDVGFAPQGLVVSDDRRTLYVHNFMDRTVNVFDLTPLIDQGVASAKLVATLKTVAKERLTPQVLLGKQLFYDARDPRLSNDRYMSCATCHNDGGQDGRVWDLTAQGEGLRNTVSLRGRGGAQGRLHWSNNFDEIQDFEAQIRSLAGGTGLMTDAQFNTGTRSQPLGDKKAGVSPDLDALAAYVRSLDEFDPSPFRQTNGTLTNDGAAGKALFASLNCASCHTGRAFTRSGADNPADIGTLKSTSGTRLGSALAGIDVPTLRDAWMTAPYLHDGSAATLEDAIRAHRNVTVTDADVAQLAAFVRQIGNAESSAPVVASGGLAASYFNNITLSGSPALTRVEAVDFAWGQASPGAGVNTDMFSARWTGQIMVPATGSYTFQTESDDGVRLWINGVLMIDNWTDHGPTANTTNAVWLTAGQQVDVVLEYYDRTRGAVIRLRWQQPGTTGFVAIPASQLSPAAPAAQGLAAEYYNGVVLSGVAQRRFEAVDFEWLGNAPVQGVTPDYFAARWSGTVTLPATGTYRFRTISDDGVRLTVNGALVIDDWTAHPVTTDTTGPMDFVKGQRVPIELRYYQGRGAAVMRLQWQPPGAVDFVPIPIERLNAQ